VSRKAELAPDGFLEESRASLTFSYIWARTYWALSSLHVKGIPHAKIWNRTDDSGLPYCMAFLGEVTPWGEAQVALANVNLFQSLRTIDRH